MRVKGLFAFFTLAASISFGLSPLLAPLSAASGPASLYIDAAKTSFAIGDTFSASILVDTGGNSINAVDAQVLFPPDKLQVVNARTGNSIVRIWVNQPSFSNSAGTIHFQGAIPPPGIDTGSGLISEVTFRTVGMGTALIRFADSSKVLLNDGRGTNALGSTSGAMINVKLPPPQGPAVVSPTHPDENRWYSERNVQLEWKSRNPVDGYSYVLNDQPIDSPDNISEGSRTSAVYRNLADGVYFLHIKSLRGGIWGGVSHYIIRVDGTPPADFSVRISPSARTDVTKPSIIFDATDAASGLDHYELQIIPLAPETSSTPFFVDASSPYAPELNYGKYDVAVRAYDRAGNFLQKTQRIEIIPAVSDIFGDQGIKLQNGLLMPWLWIFILSGLAIIVLGSYAGMILQTHRTYKNIVRSGAPTADLQKQMNELKELRKRYSKMSIYILVLGSALSSLFFGRAVKAEMVELSPPIVNVAARSISNQESFYISGSSDAPGSQVTVYIQNVQTGETISNTIPVDNDGRWFYSHPSFLQSGSYIAWTQARIGRITSPPGPQVEFRVLPAALQIGASRISFESAYLIISALLVLILVSLLSTALYYRRQIRKKRQYLLNDARQAEEAIRRGFAMLHRDVDAEFKLVQSIKRSRALTLEEKILEKQILRDLETVKRYIGQEVLDMERDAG